ncbi:MAG: putative methyltransferase YcgJ [Gammaproteobacteria bacterium]|nr:putative methyltransferase YcgJ [Gammaproteobacteria bacterium]
MSSYENYSERAQTYDHTRKPVGVEIIVGCLSKSSVPLTQQYLLDAGCGTGNYSGAMIKHVARIAAVDLNIQMLARAHAKFADPDKGRIAFHQASIERLPFGAAVFDGVMVNQVMHHLADQAESGYPRIRSVLTEFARVLKPGGMIVINTCSRRQLRKGFWYGSLIPEQINRMCERHIPLSFLQEILHESGFESAHRIVPVDALMQGRSYFNARGPCEKTWRDGDSIWSTVPQKRIDEICAQLEQLAQAGKLEDFMRERDATRSEVGQMTFVRATRIAAGAHGT